FPNFQSLSAEYFPSISPSPANIMSIGASFNISTSPIIALGGEDWIERFISSIMNAEQSEAYPSIDGAVAIAIEGIPKEKLIYLAISHITPEPTAIITSLLLS